MIGELIGHYEIKKKLGQGGMGVVYQAKDTRLLRSVALKVLPSELTADENNLRRFIQEAQTASALNHPNICTIHDINNDGGLYFIVMELIEGVTLRKLLEDNGPMTESDVVDIAIKICNALGAVHKKGVLHRDIKPENIMITNSGYLKVMDFGLAKLATDAAGRTANHEADEMYSKNIDTIKERYANKALLTTISGLLGTVSYMSPEQAQGKEIDHRSDIFSLGIVLFELLTNKRPFDGGSNATVLSKIIVDPVMHGDLDTRDISTPMRKIINRCLEKDVDKRYQSVGELLPELKKIKKTLEARQKDRRTDRSIIREPERKQITVMFTEISNYDEIIENMESEETASIMNSCFDMFAAAIEQHGGKVDSIMSGTIKSLFGTAAESETAHKDAVNSAIQIRNGLVQFNQQFNVAIPLGIKIGINTGTVILGTMGSGNTQNYMIMGDTVTGASLLKDHSGSGQIFVGALTYKLTKDDFNYAIHESLSIKGKEERLQAYELLSEREKIHRPQLGAERQIYSEMVGRDKELTSLKFHVYNLIDGKGHIVNVIGEAGIGKSRLIAELKKQEEIKGITLLEGRGLSIGKNLSFHPLRDLLKNWSGISEDDSDSKAFEKLKCLIENIYPENADEIIPFVATLMGMELSGNYAERVKGIKGEALERLILKNLREFLEKTASKKPVVFIIEDLHWSDNTTIEFLELIFRLALQNSILFINVFRPGYEYTGERLLESITERYPGLHEEIYLEALDEQYGEMLINNLLKIEGFSSSITNLIAKRAGGNPFFIEEVVRSFIDDGVIKIADRKFVVTDKIESVTIPENLNEVLLSRIDKLDEGTKSLLKMASVIGRNFFYKIIAEVARATDEIDSRLSYLQDVQLIKQHKRMQEVEYLFKHALAQVAVYESILNKKRKELHIKTAEAIESVFADKLPLFYGVLSFHYSIGENSDKAEEYLIKAGEEALKSSASSEAIEYFKGALNLYTKKHGGAADPHKKAMLEYNIAVALQNKGRQIEAIEYFEILQSYYDLKLPKNNLMAATKAVLGLAHFLVGINFPRLKWKKKPGEKDNELEKFFMYWNKSVTLTFPKRGLLAILCRQIRVTKIDFSEYPHFKQNLLGLSTVFSFVGAPGSIHKKILFLLNDSIDKGNPTEMVWYCMSKQLYNWVWGKWKKDEGEEYDENILHRGQKAGELIAPTLYMNQYNLTKIERGEFSNVQAMVREMKEIGETYENDYTRGLSLATSTKLLMKYRKLSKALDEAEIGIKFNSKINNLLFLFESASFKSKIELIDSDIDSAEKSLEFVKTLDFKNVVPWGLSGYLTSQFLFDMYRLEESITIGNTPDISRYKKAALESGRKAYNNSKKFAGDRIEIYKLMGTYYWLINKQKKALKWWDRSIKFGEESGGRLELSRTFMEVGKRLLEPKSKYDKLNDVTAEEYLDKARTMFEEMDLQWDLNELEKAKSPSRL